MFAAFGSAIVFAATLIIIVFCIAQPSQWEKQPAMPASFANFITSFTIALYAYEGQAAVSGHVWGMGFTGKGNVPSEGEGVIYILSLVLFHWCLCQVMPVENKIKHPREMTHNFGVLFTVNAFLMLLGVAIGFYGYAAFGDKTHNPITLNLPRFVSL
jgi:hypothetical protein